MVHWPNEEDEGMAHSGGLEQPKPDTTSVRPGTWVGITPLVPHLCSSESAGCLLHVALEMHVALGAHSVLLSLNLVS